MGRGKVPSAAAARALRRAVRGVDERIESAAGAGSGIFFVREGEPAFREREKAALRDALSVKRCVIATGGGAFSDEENRVLLRSYAPVVYSEAAVETILERVAGISGVRCFRGGDRKRSSGKLLVARRSTGIAPPTSRCAPTGERWRKWPGRWPDWIDRTEGNAD